MKGPNVIKYALIVEKKNSNSLAVLLAKKHSDDMTKLSLGLLFSKNV